VENEGATQVPNERPRPRWAREKVMPRINSRTLTTAAEDLRARALGKLPTVAAVPLMIVYRNVRWAAERRANVEFLRRPTRHATFSQRLALVLRTYLISCAVECAHRQEEVLPVIGKILSLGEEVAGCIVEAGSYKGGSAAKFSVAAALAKRKLVIFDSFQGIPQNEEEHQTSIFGEAVGFGGGFYRGGLAEVRANVARYGCLDACEFVKGWFEETMPRFAHPVAVAYLDVDLASSTRTCLRYLYPLLSRGGMLASQDGHLPLVLAVFDDNSFWRDELGEEKPAIEGYGTRKLISIVKQ